MKCEAHKSIALKPPKIKRKWVVKKCAELKKEGEEHKLVQVPKNNGKLGRLKATRNKYLQMPLMKKTQATERFVK